MDIESGNIEILFQKIPHDYIVRKSIDSKILHTYKSVNKQLYMKYASETFINASPDECKNNYLYMCSQMNDTQENNLGIFKLIFWICEKMLRRDGDEIKCKFEQMLRWRKISLQLGQDFFTCAYLAEYDLKRGKETKKFTWLPVIKSDNSRLHNILQKGVAENHFHLNGSTKIFELNWLCVMNQIEDRQKDFKKIKTTLQQRYMDRFSDLKRMDNFCEECQRAALYRVYLFSILKEDSFIKENAEKIIRLLNRGMLLSEAVFDIQNLISLTRNIYGAKIDDYVLDYAFEKKLIYDNNNECRLLAGERSLLYNCYKFVLSNKFSDEQKNIFYAYLSIRTDFRGEIIQINNKVGFENFSNYQNRKEYFIEGNNAYKSELVHLALNETLVKDNVVSLEARICPKNSSYKLYTALQTYEKIVKTGSKDDMYDKLIFVLHFPKLFDKGYIPGTPRNENVRKSSARQARSIVALLEKNTEFNRKLKGIDACSSEIACRPEVFGQVFRYLADTTVDYIRRNNNTFSEKSYVQNLHMTYHVGEDFFDIIDGLRAIDEVLLFCNLIRGSRLGHALALGIAPEEYYSFKGYKVLMSKQMLLDNIVWMYCKAGKMGCFIEEKLRSEMREKYYELYKYIYENTVQKKEEKIACPGIHEYYQSWKLRGDKPDLYRLSRNEFMLKLKKVELNRFDRYQFNPLVNNDIRKNDTYRNLYYWYHYNEKVRICGNEIVEFKVTKEYVELVRQLQDKIIQELVHRGIGIETNPSSNYLIGTIKKYENHPIVRFNSRKLRECTDYNCLSVSINTDDQGVFDTLLENEYALMTLALKKAKDENMNLLYNLEDIYEWIDYVRSMGIDQVFS